MELCCVRAGIANQQGSNIYLGLRKLFFLYNYCILLGKKPTVYSQTANHASLPHIVQKNCFQMDSIFKYKKTCNINIKRHVMRERRLASQAMFYFLNCIVSTEMNILCLSLNSMLMCIYMCVCVHMYVYTQTYLYFMCDILHNKL